MQWGALRRGGLARVNIDTWLRERTTRKVLRRDWTALADSPDRLGASNKDVRAVVFLDFECPFCVAQWPKLDSLLVVHPNVVAIAVRHLPLPMHPAAEGAARASICAGRQGRFSAIARELFTHRQWHEDRDWSREARSAGVPDIAEFRECLRAPTTISRLATDSAFAHDLGISATPTFVLTDRVQPGLLSQVALGQVLGTSSPAARLAKVQ